MLLQQHIENSIECGIDEAGRGALAGPVVAAAVVWDPSINDPMVEQIKDSKKLSPKKRQILAEFIKTHARAWAVSFIDNNVIDAVNILQATYMAMHDAIDQVVSIATGVDHIIVDGNRFKPYKSIHHTCIIQGDNKYISIAAASILAKVAHDDFMLECAKEDGMGIYAWDKNMGYGTSVHMNAIRTNGLSKYHRKTFTAANKD